MALPARWSVNSNGADHMQWWRSRTHYTPGQLLCWPKFTVAVVPSALEAELLPWDFPLA